LEKVMAGRNDPTQDPEHRWEGLQEIDRAISENRLMSYRWKKALADPWERRGLWLILLIFFAFFAFVVGQEVLR
jgi:hypothetical protein